MVCAIWAMHFGGLGDGLCKIFVHPLKIMFTSLVSNNGSFS